MALSSDYIIQIAPTLSAAPGDLSVHLIADRALILSIVTGVIAIGLAYIMLRKQIKKPSEVHLRKWESMGDETEQETSSEKEFSVIEEKQAKLFAFIVPIVFATIVGYMIYAKITSSVEIEGGDGAAIVGGGALLLLLFATFTHHPKKALEKVSNHIIEGLLFAFKAMGIVLPIAGFFF